MFDNKSIAYAHQASVRQYGIKVLALGAHEEGVTPAAHANQGPSS
jgi:hypothetical protein